MSTGELIAVLLVAAGAFFILSGTLGLLRFPDALSRLHALAKADNVGLGLICAGLAVHDGTAAGIVTLFFIWLLALVASTVSVFLLAGWKEARREGRDEP